jgi:hypothetical protein
MPTQKQILVHALTGGMDTRTDRFQIQPPKLSVLYNAIFIPGGLQQRSGMKKLVELSTVRRTSFPVAKGVPVAGARILVPTPSTPLLITDSDYFSYDRQYGEWRDLPASLFGNPFGLPLCSVRKSVISSAGGSVGGTGIKSFAVARSTAGFFVCVRSGDASGTGAAISVYDEVTGALIQEAGIGFGVNVRAVSIGRSVIVTQVQAGAPSTITASVITPDISDRLLLNVAQSQIVADADAANYCYDLAGVEGGRAFLAYYSSTANTIKMIWIDSTLGTTAPVAQASAGVVSSIGVAACSDPAQSVAVAWAMNATTRVDARAFDQSLAPVYAAVTLSTTAVAAKFAAPNQTCIALAFNGLPSAGGTLAAFWDNGNATPASKSVRAVSVTSAGAASAETTVADGCEIMSSAFVVAGSAVIMIKKATTYDGFLMGLRPGLAVQPPNVLASVQPGSMGPGPDGSFAHTIGVQVVGSKAVAFVPCLLSGPGLDGSGLSASVWRAKEFNFADDSAHDSVQVGDETYISGGMLRVFDGRTAYEAGILVSPYQGVTATPSNAGGSLAPSTTYTYRVYYEKYTASGARFMSSSLGKGTSDALGFTGTTGAADNRMSLVVPAASPSISGANAVFFRREQNGINFHRVSPKDARLITTPLIDTMSEANLILQELDPISKGVSVPIPAPPHTVIAAGNGRVFLSGLDDPDLIMYSLTRETGEPLQFAAENRIVVQQGDGPITALVAVADSLVIFRENQTYLCGGDGLNNTATVGAFTTPRLISNEIGCDEPRSIVEFPQGAAFKSAKGYYLISASGGLEFIGADMIEFNSLPVRAAVLMPTLHQIRWVTDTITLVYDYEFKQWSPWTVGGRDACIWQGSFLLLPGTTGRVCVETAGYWMDDAISDAGEYALALTTGWLKPAGVHGRIMLYEVLVAGDLVAAHQPALLFAYDGEEAFVERRSWDPRTVLSAAEASYGGQAYGAGIYGGQNADGTPATTVYQFSVKPLIERCSMVKIRLEMGPPQGAAWSGGSATLHELALVIGIRDGAIKLGKTKRA